jgi:hypothetical protein
MKTLVKIGLVDGFLLLVAGVLIAWGSPATGYESSIYWSTPISFWVCLFTATFISIVIVIYSLYFVKEKNRLWLWGISLIILCNVLLSSLYIIRSYGLLAVRGDEGIHLGYIKDIITYGLSGAENLGYPLMHVSVAYVSKWLSINPEVVLELTPIFFCILYVVFMGLLADLLAGKRVAILVALISALAFPGLIYTVPSSLADLTLPLILFLLVKSLRSGWKWKALFVCSLVLVCIFHQLTAAMAFVSLLVIPVVYFFLSKERKIASLVFYGLILAVVVTGFVYVQSPTIKTLASTMVPISATDSISAMSSGSLIQPFGGLSDERLTPSQTSVGKSNLGQIVDIIRYACRYGYSGEVAEQFFKIYGTPLALILCTLVSILLLRRQWSKYNLLVPFLVLVGVISLMLLVLLFTGISFGPLRLIVYLTLLGTIFAGLILDRVIRGKRTWLVFIVVLLLFGVSYNGIMIKYPSPYLLSTSLQDSQQEIEGTRWFLENRDPNIRIASWDFAPDRYAFYFYGIKGGSDQYYELRPLVKQLPFHLGYNKHNMIGQNFGNDTYVVMTNRIERRYIDLFPEIAKYRLLPSDIDKLNKDSSATKIYDNGDFRVWYAKSIEN